MKIKGFSSQNELNEFLELNDINYMDSDSIRFNNPSINEVDSPSPLDLEEDYGNYEYYEEYSDDYEDYKEDYGDYLVYEEYYGDYVDDEEYEYNFEEDLPIDVYVIKKINRYFIGV